MSELYPEEEKVFSDFCKSSNKEILGYFSKFCKNKNYENHYKNLDLLSIYRIKEDIEVGNLKMPNIGPSNDLINFPDTLENWNDKEIFEIKNVIKLYDSGEIESLEEAIILIEIIKIKENYPKILDVIISDLKSGSLENIEKYSELLTFDNSCEDSIIYGNIWKYLLTLTCS